MPRRPVALAVLAAFLAQQAPAANFSVTNTLDDGSAGGLRKAVTDSNAAGGANSILWGPGSGGTLTISGGDLPTLITNTLLNASSAPSAVTIASSSGALALGGVTTLFNGTTTQTWTISAAVIGSGSVTKAGGGTLALTGVNTYTGGTTVSSGTLAVNSDAALGAASGGLGVSGGGLQALASFSSARTVTITTSAVIDTNGSNITLSGVVNGGGSIVKNGAGTLSLTGNDSLGQGLVVNAGTLSAAGTAALGGGPLTLNGGALQAAGSLVTGVNVTLGAGAATFDTDGTTSTFSGTVTGPGSLVLVGTGTLKLTGANTFGGGVTLNAGTLAITSDASLGLSTGPLSFNGGTLQAAASFASARGVSIPGTATIDTNNNAVSWSGIMSGLGGLVKTGSGTLTLSGLNTFTGGTLVNGGTLALGANNALPTLGALTVSSGGGFDLGAYKQTVASLSGGGLLSMVLSPGTTNLTVTGQANMTTASLSVRMPPQIVRAGDTFTPVIYGSSVGAFASITAPAALSFIPAYGAGGLTLTASLVPFSKVSATANQAAVGNALEPLRANPSGDAAVVLANLYSLDAAHLQAAMDRISPVALASMKGLGFSASGVQSAAVSRRMAALADGSARRRYSTYTVSRPSPYPGTLLAEPPGDSAAAERGAPPRPGWSYFTSGVVTAGRLAEASGGGGSQPGYAFNTAGLTAGADRPVDDRVAVGGSVGYLHGHTSLYAPGGGTVDSQSLRFGLYATSLGDAFHADVYLGGAVDMFSARRRVLFATVDRTATSKPLGTELDLHPSLSYDVRTAQSGTFSPFAGLNYDRLMVGSFSESGADSLDLTVSPQTAESLQSLLGLRWMQEFSGETVTFRPYLSAGWRREFASQSRAIDAQLAAPGGGSFSVKTGDTAKDGSAVGLGVELDVSRATTARFDYAGDFRSHYQDSTVNASLRFRF